MWMDHRSTLEAQKLSQTQLDVLNHYGGSFSPEMSIAKILWLYNNDPNYIKQQYMELPDFLTWKATGSLSRGLNSLVCKWGFIREWSQSLFEGAGVKKEDVQELIQKIQGPSITRPGLPIEGGLSKEAAQQLGLQPGLPVGGGLIDAYAGALGTLCVSKKPSQILTRMAIICGTSSCHITLTPNPVFVKGVWGPYPDALIQGYHCLEGGQSLTGKAIETLIQHHPLYPPFKEKAEQSNDTIFELLNKALKDLQHERKVEFTAELVQHFHIFPDLYGNRSPLQDPLLRGMISGMQVPLKNPKTLPPPTLILFYYATLLGLCYGTRFIIEAHSKNGIVIEELVLSGGLATNPLWAQSLADVCGIPVLLGKCLPDQATLLGAAISGASASKGKDSLLECMTKMTSLGQTYEPNKADKLVKFHAKKYQVYLKMIRDQYEYRQMMK
ncbi:hypothetical protein EDD86DRAFT_208225 [Gorgonomyces haynaldii]|nr:hypothetical protein EDD86DRAFT_208225 [Gorgonomyces haynaldii]